MASTERKEVPIKLLLVALGIGIIAALLAVWYLNAKEAQLRRELTPQVEMRSAIVATKELLKGTVLDSTMLAVRSIPASYLNREALLPGDFAVIDGKVLIANVDAGNVILESYVATGFPLDFSDTIQLKRRAMTIQVDELNSINGFIRAGNRIDLFANLPSGSIAGDDNKTDAIIPILENVEVLATGKTAAYEYEEQVRILRGGSDSNIDNNFTTLTLNVTPREAAILVTAQEKGSMLALLRNRKDHSGSGFDKVIPTDLLLHAAKMAADALIREAAAAIVGLVVGEDGIIRTKDGVELKNQSLIVRADGTIMTKDGIILSGRGLTINENGELVDAEGNVVDPDTLTVAPDGSIITADGSVLGGEKAIALSLQDVKVVRNADGSGVLQSADGTVITGLNINENGKVVLADGTEVDPSDLVVGSDGQLYTKDGVLVGGQVGVAVGELTANADGTITAANGAIIRGASLNKDGMLVLADGRIVDPDDVVILADGTVVTKSGEVLAGLSADTSAVAGLAAVSDAADNVAAGQLTLNADGTITTSSGAIIKGATLNEDGMLVLPDGRVVDPADVVIRADGTVVIKPGAVIKGATLNEDGMLVLPDGRVIDPKDVIIRPDGTVITKSEEILVGLSADVSGVQSLASALSYDVDYIIGGVSENGIAEVNKVIVEQEK